MKLPKKVRVGGHDIDVAAVVMDKGGWGEYRPADGVIELNAEASPSQQATTLVHEILHVCFQEVGLNLHFKPTQEEQIVRSLEPLLYQVIRDNPAVIKFIQRGGK